MKTVLAILLASALVGIADADAASAKKKGVQRDASRPVVKVQPAPVGRDIDETRYYERLSEKIPFGSGTWWRQRQLENPTP